MQHTIPFTRRQRRFSLSYLTPFLLTAVLPSCERFDPQSDTIADVQAAVVGECLPQPPGAFRPECQSSWNESDATAAIHEAIDSAKQYIDATNCDIRTTLQRSPYNSNEPWCGGVVLQSGVTYPMPSSVYGTAGGTWMTHMTDYYGPDPVFGITLEADDRFGARPILELPRYSALGIGPHDRLRHLHIKGYYASHPPIPPCGGSEGECGSAGALTENGVYANGSSATEGGYSDGWKIDDCRIEGFSIYGIQAHYSRDARIVNSTITGNGNGGIYGLGSLRLYVADNEVSMNGANGVDIGSAIGSSIIERNTIYNNGWRNWSEQQGVMIGHTSNNIVRNNTIYRSPVGNCGPWCWGIIVTTGDNNQVLDNTVFGHTEAGIQVGWCHPTDGCPDSLTSNTQISGNSLNSNFVNGSNNFQIQVEGNVSGNTTVSNNVIYQPGQCFNVRSDVAYSNNVCNPSAPVPTVNSIVTNPSQARQYQYYTLTINGSGFDPANLAVVILKLLPPACTPQFGSCESYLSPHVTTPTQLVLNNQVTGTAGTYEVSVRNGRFNTRSNAMSFVVVPAY